MTTLEDLYYTYMAVGVMYDGYYWYVCVCMDSENTDLK